MKRGCLFVGLLGLLSILFMSNFIIDSISVGRYDRSDALLVFVVAFVTLTLFQLKFPRNGTETGIAVLLGLFLCALAIYQLLGAGVDFDTSQIFGGSQ